MSLWRRNGRHRSLFACLPTSFAGSAAVSGAVPRATTSPKWLPHSSSSQRACCRPQVCLVPIFGSWKGSALAACAVGRPLLPPCRRQPYSPTRRSSDSPLRRQPWPAGSGRLSPDPLGCMQHWQQRGGWQAGAPRRAGLPAGGPAAARPSPAAAAVVPGLHQRPGNMGAAQQPCGPGPPGGCGLLLAWQQLQVRRQGVCVPVGDARVAL